MGKLNEERGECSPTWTRHHGLNTRDADASRFADRDKHTCVVEVVAMASKTSDNRVTKHCQAGPVEDRPADKVPNEVSIFSFI